MVDGEISLLALPRLSDCSVNHLFEIMEALPHNLGLFLDRDAHRIRIFEVGNALRLEGAHGLIVHRLASEGVPKN